MNRKLQRIILDLEDLCDEPYIDSDNQEKILKIISELKSIYIYSTEV